MVSNEQFTSLDCLALGYLSLMLVPELPSPWLSRTLRDSFPGLASWAEEVGESIFGGKITLQDALLRESGEGEKMSRHLPWIRPQNRGFGAVGTAFAAGLVDTLPVLGVLRRDQKAQHYQIKNETEKEVQSSTWRNISIFGSVVAGLGLAVSYLLHQGILALPAREDDSSRSEIGGYGVAGAAMSVLLAPSNRPQQVERNYTHGEPVVEVDIDLKEGKVKTTEAVV